VPFLNKEKNEALLFANNRKQFWYKRTACYLKKSNLSPEIPTGYNCKSKISKLPIFWKRP